MSVKLGGPKNYYQDTDAKKLGLKSAENAINKNIEDIATNAENIATNTADITAIKAKDVEQDNKISALEAKPVLPTGGTGDNGKVVTYDENGNVYVLSTPAQGGIDAEVIAEEYDDSVVVIPGEVYSQFDVVYDSSLDLYYACKQNNTTGPWDSTKWQVLTVGEKPDTEWASINVNAVLTPTSAPRCSILEDWVSPRVPDLYIYAQQWGDVLIMGSDDPVAKGLTKVTPDAYAGEGTQEWGHTYSAGDYVMYNDELYICEDTTGGQWDSSKWTKVNVMSQLGSAPTPTSFIPRYGDYNVVSEIGKDSFENNIVYQVLVKLDSSTSHKTINIPNSFAFKRFYSIVAFKNDTQSGYYTTNIGSNTIQVTPDTTSFDVSTAALPSGQEIYVEIIFSAYDE